MKLRSKLVSLFLTLCLTAGLLPALALPASAGTITLPAVSGQTGYQNNLRSAVEAARDGDVITITDQGWATDGNNDPWVIDKAVTIQGGDLVLRASGILLGADVTLRNTRLLLPSPVRNCIMANGYTLTLENVSVDTDGAQYLNLFCGAPSPGGFTGGISVPAPGPKGRILLKGSTNVQNIYAGGISTDGKAPADNIPAEVVADPTFTGPAGNFYACGALQTPYDGNWFGDVYNGVKIDPPAPDPDRFPTRAPVSVTLFENTIPAVDGATGGSSDAAVTFVSQSENEIPLTLHNIGSLTVTGGVLRPGALTGDGMDLTLAEGAALRLSRLAALPTVRDYTGGGKLALSPSHTLTITGTAAGTTTLIAGEETYAGLSGSRLLEGHDYVVTPVAAADCFTLAPAVGESLQLVYSGGKWTAAAGDAPRPLVSSFQMEESMTFRCQDLAGNTKNALSIPLRVVYADNDSYPSLTDISPSVAVNGASLTPSLDSYGFEQYVCPLTLGGTPYRLALEFALDAEDELLVLSAYRIMDQTHPELDPPVDPPGGEYTISITIPASAAESGVPITRTLRLTVVPRGPYTLVSLSAAGPGGDLLSALPASGPFTMTVSLTRETAEAGAPRLLLAVYSGQRIVALRTAQVEIPRQGGAADLSFSLDLPAGSAPTRAKAFLLSSLEGLLPLLHPLVFPIN